jgi:hypothetical protein
MIRKPDLFIVGAPKCGTTAMSHYLGSHPDIFMGRKEMHHFGADLHFGPGFYRRDLAAYLAEFAGAGRRALVGEASVWYLASTSAAKEIKAFNPDAKIIIMLREPSEAIYSLYAQFLFDGNEWLPTLEAALAAEPVRQTGKMLSRETYLAQGLCYRQSVRFADQVSRYLEAFGSAQVRVVLLEELAANREAAGRALLAFLGADPRQCPGPLKNLNGAKTVRSRSLRLLQQDARLRSGILALRPWLPRPLFSLMQKADAGMRSLNSASRQRPAMPPELRSRLRAEFAPEVERLGRLLGRDLTHWTSGDCQPAQTGRGSVNPETPIAVKPVYAAVNSPLVTR